MFTFLLVVHAIIAAALVAVILMQRSEGGGLGMGGSPSGLMSARGAADFLTRATTILASAFVLMSIGLAALATFQRGPREIDTSLARQTAPGTVPAAPAPTVPLAGEPLGAAAAGAAANGPSSGTGAIVPATPGTAGPATAPRVTTPASDRVELPTRERTTAPKRDTEARRDTGRDAPLRSSGGGVGVATGVAAAPVIAVPQSSVPATAAPSGTNP